MDRSTVPDRPLELVIFSIFPFAYAGIHRWAEAKGHRITLLVTTPGPVSRRNTMYRELIAGVPPRQEVVVSTRMRSLAPYISSLVPDLIISFTFPYLIPPELVDIPEYGAVNLHPTALPKYRGPNPLRVVYDGESEVGATLHWIEPDFDTGNILSQHVLEVPEEATFEQAFGMLGQAAAGALAEGVELAIAGDPGRPQNHDEATYAARFGADDLVLDPSNPAWLINRQVDALRAGNQIPHIALGERYYPILDVEALEASDWAGDAGAVLSRTGAHVTIQTGSLPVRLTLGEGIDTWPELQASPV